MRKFNRIIPFLTLLIFGCNEIKDIPSAPWKEHLNKQWAKNTLWDDGQAEVAIYDAERKVYGKSRQFEYVYVLVKETFNQEYQVKTDNYDRKDLYEVMKVNKFCRIPTLAYPYHYLTSIFYQREIPGIVHKMTNTSQEWCGNSAKSFIERSNDYLFEYMTYWDGQGNGEITLDKGSWFEEQLSYTLRTLEFTDGLTFDIPIYPIQISSRANIPKAEMASISVTKPNPEELSNLDSTFIRSPWKVAINRIDGTDLIFWINGQYPNLLLKMEATDGRKLDLKEVRRAAYWEVE